mmetsp:Transcript_97696/g.301193  ORF Transcript_97696/g.301193 Transcript_97696/m.301193 type:complete len:456 (+) Transcript_97696:1365-2732(+)
MPPRVPRLAALTGREGVREVLEALLQRGGDTLGGRREPLPQLGDRLRGVVGAQRPGRDAPEDLHLAPRLVGRHLGVQVHAVLPLQRRDALAAPADEAGQGLAGEPAARERGALPEEQLDELADLLSGGRGAPPRHHREARRVAAEAQPALQTRLQLGDAGAVRAREQGVRRHRDREGRDAGAEAVLDVPPRRVEHPGGKLRGARREGEREGDLGPALEQTGLARAVEPPPNDGREASLCPAQLLSSLLRLEEAPEVDVNALRRDRRLALLLAWPAPQLRQRVLVVAEPARARLRDRARPKERLYQRLGLDSAVRPGVPRQKHTKARLPAAKQECHPGSCRTGEGRRSAVNRAEGFERRERLEQVGLLLAGQVPQARGDCGQGHRRPIRAAAAPPQQRLERLGRPGPLPWPQAREVLRSPREVPLVRSAGQGLARAGRGGRGLPPLGLCGRSRCSF